jgi:hypothetical protein
MNPKIWGPHAWIFLHTITLNFPENPTPEQKKYYKIFFETLSQIIPCDKCRFNYAKKIKNYPVNVDSKKDLVEWLLFIHNDVNRSNGKKELNFNEFINKYRELYTLKPKSEKESKYIQIKKEYINYSVLLLIVILIISLIKR